MIAPGVLKSKAMKVDCMTMSTYGAPAARKKLRKAPVQTARPDRPLPRSTDALRSATCSRYSGGRALFTALAVD